MAARCVTESPTGCGPIQWMSVLVTSCPSASKSTGGRDGPLYISLLPCWVCLTIAIVIVKGYLEKPGIRDRYRKIPPRLCPEQQHRSESRFPTIKYRKMSFYFAERVLVPISFYRHCAKYFSVINADSWTLKVFKLFLRVMIAKLISGCFK